MADHCSTVQRRSSVPQHHCSTRMILFTTMQALFRPRHLPTPKLYPACLRLRAHYVLSSGVQTGESWSWQSLRTELNSSGRSHLLSLDETVPESVRTPAVAAWLEDVALRDLVLHEKHAACIDAKGDVYQWGDGFFGTSNSSERPSSSGRPSLTLRGKVFINFRTRYFAMI